MKLVTRMPVVRIEKAEINNVKVITLKAWVRRVCGLD